MYGGSMVELFARIQRPLLLFPVKDDPVKIYESYVHLLSYRFPTSQCISSLFPSLDHNAFLHTPLDRHHQELEVCCEVLLSLSAQYLHYHLTASLDSFIPTTTIPDTTEDTIGSMIMPNDLKEAQDKLDQAKETDAQQAVMVKMQHLWQDTWSWFHQHIGKNLLPHHHHQQQQKQHEHEHEEGKSDAKEAEEEGEEGGKLHQALEHTKAWGHSMKETLFHPHHHHHKHQNQSQEEHKGEEEGVEHHAEEEPRVTHDKHVHKDIEHIKKAHVGEGDIPHDKDTTKEFKPQDIMKKEEKEEQQQQQQAGRKDADSGEYEDKTNHNPITVVPMEPFDHQQHQSAA